MIYRVKTPPAWPGRPVECQQFSFNLPPWPRCSNKLPRGRTHRKLHHSEKQHQRTNNFPILSLSSSPLQFEHILTRTIPGFQLLLVLINICTVSRRVVVCFRNFCKISFDKDKFIMIWNLNCFWHLRQVHGSFPDMRECISTIWQIFWFWEIVIRGEFENFLCIVMRNQTASWEYS